MLKVSEMENIYVYSMFIFFKSTILLLCSFATFISNKCTMITYEIILCIT